MLSVVQFSFGTCSYIKTPISIRANSVESSILKKLLEKFDGVTTTGQIAQRCFKIGLTEMATKHKVTLTTEEHEALQKEFEGKN